jgi:hypothetical protein
MSTSTACQEDLEMIHLFGGLLSVSALLLFSVYCLRPVSFAFAHHPPSFSNFKFNE